MAPARPASRAWEGWKHRVTLTLIPPSERILQAPRPAVVKDRLKTPGPGAYGSDGVPENSKYYTGGNRSHTRKGPLDSEPRRAPRKEG